ncbi:MULTISPECIES: hypothetical protein [unclassified Sphingobacterium]|uniref:hypothetical protein n=1 Tax=unclassified Sphingobacterium TaxID=2609468 RepID=UPI0010530635|nr:MULTISPECIES: hypothetical protein [unclassified Sphingobacterium]MCS3553150.1 hypothetical protein [Sphingobacterium sp. JUb21]TCR09640.1 hypothetical protein EDF66_102442 [Sphingobacterium sp. JUb20]
MSTLKINRLRTGIILSFLLLIGTFFVVKAMDKKEVVKKTTTQQQWYSTDASGQNIVALLTTPPPNVGGEGCDQMNNGDFCAKLLEFDENVNPTQLEGNSISDIETNITAIQERGAAKHESTN